ncbi:MAG: DUF2798 domain-containing protein [Rhodocyclaceae bacterium]|nr:MAG: DUF2798 domain-containing protein [Rhodocyclaceae bacterium]
MVRLSSRYSHLAFSVVMALVMVTLMTFVVTWTNVGFVPDFLTRWGHAWLVAYSVALPVIYVFAPRVRRLVMRFVDQPG